MNLPAPVLAEHHLKPMKLDHRQLIEHFLSGKSSRTIDRYRSALENFAAFLGIEDDPLNTMAAYLLDAGQGGANSLVLSYRQHLVDLELAPQTINLRLSAIRSVIKLANLLGLCPWTIEVRLVKRKMYKQTAGPGAESVRDMLGHWRERTDPVGVRNYAILWLLYGLAFRRSTVEALNVSDVDLDKETLSVWLKGHNEPEPMHISRPVKEALERWLEVRATLPDLHTEALFVTMPLHNKSQYGQRLAAGTGIYRLVRDTAAKFGVTTSPHGLRHTAITEALERTGGDLRAVSAFSGHANVQTLQIYDDNRRQASKRVAELVSDL